MSEKLIAKVKALIDEGKSFNYANFAAKNKSGFPSSISIEYSAWKLKVENLLFSRLGKSSPIFLKFKDADSVKLLGAGPVRFDNAQNAILGSLNAAIDTIEFEPKTKESEIKKAEGSNKVFVVHGHDEKMKTEMEVFLTEIGLEPVVLHRKPDEGLTVIEKIEKHSDVGYAFILLTPDDVSYPASEDSKVDSDRKKDRIPRQNVIFEFGYFVGKLGRNRVCCLYKKGVSLPTDVSGMIYKEIIDKVEEVAFGILKDLKAAGYGVTF